MKKKTKQKRPLTKKTTTSKAIKQVLRENKPMFAAFGTGFVLVLVIGSTFAWSSFSSWVKNHMQSEVGTLEVKIIEDYEQDSVFDKGKTIKKKVDVKNISKYPAIVRVQFLESTAVFAIDGQTGMLQKKGNDGTVADKVKTETWKKGSIYPSELEKDKYYVIADAETGYQYKFQEGNSRPKLLKPYVLNFTTALKTQPEATAAPYWIYEDGFFYYSKVLEGDQQSEINVLDSVTVAKNDLVNPAKNTLYKIDVAAYGVRANEGSLNKWTVSQSIKDMYKKDPKFEE